MHEDSRLCFVSGDVAYVLVRLKLSLSDVIEPTADSIGIVDLLLLHAVSLLRLRLVFVITQSLEQRVFSLLHFSTVVHAVYVVFAVLALAFVCAWHIPFVALTVFLLAV